MSKSRVEEALHSADIQCSASGARLTTKRKRALTLLLEAEYPISAYELVDAYKERYGGVTHGDVSLSHVELLVEERLIHRLQSVAKYTACKHIACDHPHERQQFLICDNCEAVSEVDINQDILASLKASLSQTGFQLDDQQLELHGVCEKCK